MKKSILYLFLAAASFWSCENSDDSVFEKSADTRLNEALASYESQLAGAQYGWNAVIYPGGGGSYGFYMKFDDKNRVSMLSDFSDESAVKVKESSYRLKAMQTPTLIFDTYGYIHVIADPDGEKNGGADGEGLISDFEFTIYPDSLKADRLVFIGRKNKSKLVLTRATQAQQVAYNSGTMAAGKALENVSKYLVYFKRVTLGNTTYGISVDPVSRMITFTWLDGSTPKSFTTMYYSGAAGVIFQNPLVNGSTTISGFSAVAWDAAKTQVSVTANGTTSVIGTANKPMVVDLNAAKRWYSEPLPTGGEWRTRYGFHIDGVDDALGVEKLSYGDGSPYYVYMFIPGGTTSYDLLAPTYVVSGTLSLLYGNLMESNYSNDGRVVFTDVRTVGTNPPTSGPFVETKKQFIEPSGYYLIQTGAKSYDMVSAKDGKAWISWFRP